MATRDRVRSQPTRTGAPAVTVVGYDGMDASRGAVEVAARRAGADGTLVVVYVVEPLPDWLGRPYYERRMDERHMHAQRTFDALGGIDLGAATIETQVIEGRPAEALIRVAQIRGAREIVVGSRRPGRFRGIRGSVARGLLEQTDRPVVIVTDPLTAPEVVRAHAHAVPQAVTPA